MQQLKSGSLLQGGRYKIEMVLGQGGFGITYLATQELLNRKVAIKEFFYKDYCERDEATSHVTLGTNSNRELVERFMEKFIKEARTISTLNHPHIIRIYDIFKENNTAYYVMEYIEGESLNDMVNRRGALPEDMAVSYIKQVASALDFVHQHSINHLDVKPANIMVRKEDRQAVLIDFGLSKQYDASGEQTSTTPVGISHGYAPMEQYNAGGVGTFSPQTDIYSLGATLYKLVTGNTPPQAIEIFNDSLPELSANISSFVVEAIKKAMQPKKAERYNSIKEFVFKLNTKQNERSESVSFDKEETIVIKETQIKTKQDIAAHRKEKKSNYYAIILNVIIIVLAALFIILELSENESLEIKDADSVRIEMRKQQINDSIEMVRREDAEKRRKDSINVLNEQARLETVRKLEEERKRKELELNIDRSGYVNGHMAVDLGLSVRWATCNLGASKPSDYGEYFAWGETSSKKEFTFENSITYNKNVSKIGGTYRYDAARHNWGDGWRLPTKKESEELINKCTWIWTSLDGHNGYKIIGSNGNSIFLPASFSHSIGNGGSYWCSTTIENKSAYILNFIDELQEVRLSMRKYGESIRAVAPF